jgi:hypothetical protein
MKARVMFKNKNDRTSNAYVFLDKLNLCNIPRVGKVVVMNRTKLKIRQTERRIEKLASELVQKWFRNKHRGGGVQI